MEHYKNFLIDKDYSVSGAETDDSSYWLLIIDSEYYLYKQSWFVGIYDEPPVRTTDKILWYTFGNTSFAGEEVLSLQNEVIRQLFYIKSKGEIK